MLTFHLKGINPSSRRIIERRDGRKGTKGEGKEVKTEEKLGTEKRGGELERRRDKGSGGGESE